MSSKKEVQHVYLVGAKSLGAYGGYETFVYKLTEYHQNKENIKYHVACKANGDGCMDESKFDGVTKINEHEFELHNAHCFKIDVPQIGPAQAIYYDVAALKACCEHIKKNHIPHPIVYIMACRIGPFASHFYREIHKLGGTVYLNPDGHEWMRAKWSAPIRKYWKISEQMMVKYCDLAICDSVNIEKYIHECYDGKGIQGSSPKTTFIAYGADLTLSKLADDDEKLMNWYREKGLTKKDYYLVVGRFVPENSFEVMIREFMKSKSKKNFAIITNVNEKFLNSVVLIPNTFMWWIMNSSDRVMVTYMIGAAANGIYAVSYKLPTLVSTLTGIFNQAWSYSAIREEGTSDETEYNNKMFKTLSAIAFMMGIGLLLLTKPFLGVYVADSYYDAWKYTPFLIIGCVYLTLGTFMATSYTVHKDSFGYLFSGSFGAAFNILLNFILIPVIGVYGAALATCISYIAVFMFRVFHTRKYIKYDIMYKEFILGSLLMLVSAILMFVDGMKGFLLQLVILLIGFTVFSKTWIPMLQFFLNKIQRKRVS